MIDAPTALNEGLRAQSNAVTRAERVNGRDWQREALDFSAIFGTRFPEWAATNQTPQTELMAQMIGGAVQEISKSQEISLGGLNPEEQKFALCELKRVRNMCNLCGMRSPGEILDADLLMQSNAVAHAERVKGRDWQQEAALDSTRAFMTSFPIWAQERCQADSPASSNEPPYTVQVMAQITNAVYEIAKTQVSLLTEPRVDNQAVAIAGLNRVRDRCGLLAGDPRQLAAADLLMQTNAYTDVKRTDGFDWQKDALDHTRVFRARFPSWAQQYEQQAQSNTNMPPFTKEQQAEVATLAAAVEKIQADCVKEPVPPDQLDAIRKIERIRELLPPDQQQQQQQQQQ